MAVREQNVKIRERSDTLTSLVEELAIRYDEQYHSLMQYQQPSVL